MKCREEDVNVLDAAAALILLRNRSPPDRPPPPGNPLRPSDLAAAALGFKQAASISLPPWGIRLRRSACVCRSKREHDESSSSSAAAEAAACSRPSPPTPLDYFGTSSDPSTSGSDGHTSSDIAPVKRLRSGDPSAPLSIVETKDSAPERSPLVEAAVTTWRPIRRQGKKKTISELQAQEMSLMEENSLLVKLVESKRKDVEVLFAENRSLKSESTSLKMQIEPSAAASESTKTAFLLPDLNEPVLMESPDS